jgi:hypothetical protein
VAARNAKIEISKGDSPAGEIALLLIPPLTQARACAKYLKKAIDCMIVKAYLLRYL